ncbi:SCO family protein [Aliikangiella marina]|uniref:SCO family protein n=1 Tax=Aliikangiella marina TaxID=1712262 RepID=A0A545T4H3_9GAMM|nr:SCO family protein [Aliikangiella marina]TQV72126.1 SCO family protein [Aliikangiella marina]
METTHNYSKRITYAAMVIGAAIVVILSYVLLTSDDLPSRNVGGEDGVLGGEFTLNSLHGDVSLSDYRGKLVIVYFGFIQCSQVCPVSMRTIQRTLESMEPQEVDNIQVILVSVDADDTYEALDAYAKKYHPNVVGVTGTLDQIRDVIDEYGSYYAPNDLEEFDKGRAFRHSSRYYLVNQKGELVDAMRHSSTPNEIRARLRELIKEGESL